MPYVSWGGYFNLIVFRLLKKGLIVIFIPVIYVIFGFRPYKIFGLVSVLVIFFFQNTSLPHPTQQICLCGTDLAFSFHFF